MTDTTYRNVEEIDERLADVHAEITNLTSTFEGRKFDEAARAEWNRLNGERDELQTLRAEKVTVRERLREMAGNPNATEQPAQFRTDQAGNGSVGHTEPRDGIPALWPDEDQVRQLHAAVRTGTNLRLESRAVVDSSTTGAANLATQAPTKTRRERRLAVAAGLSVERVAGVTQSKFAVFGDADDASIVSEGTSKAEYDDISAGSATPQTIAIWTDTTRQNILTMTNFEQRLRSKLSAKVADREDKLMIDTVVNTSGIQTLGGPVTPDLLLQGAAQVAAGGAASEPTLVAINPANAPDILGPDVGSGGSASPGFTAFLPDIHNMIVYVTNHASEDEAVIGAWAAGAHFVSGLSPTFLVDSMSGVKTNTVTMLLEEMVAIAVDEPSAFLHISAT